MMKNTGFTYIELIFTLAIMAVIASAVMPYIELSVTRKKEAELRHSLRQIRTAIDNYKKAVEQGVIIVNADESGYPANLNMLATGAENANDPYHHKIIFLRRLPRDPMSPLNEVAATDTWGLRSSESSADVPEPGRDVFDVYSLSTKMGLNGIPYNEW